MKAFLLAVVATVAIGISSWAVLGSLDMSATDVYSTSNVRQ